MGMLFNKYASPFTLLNGYIRTGRFCEFVETICAEKIEADKWEFFLHKIKDMNFDEFCNNLQKNNEVESMTEEEMSEIVKQSMQILHGYKPPEKEGE